MAGDLLVVLLGDLGVLRVDDLDGLVPLPGEDRRLDGLKYLGGGIRYGWACGTRGPWSSARTSGGRSSVTRGASKSCTAPSPTASWNVSDAQPAQRRRARPHAARVRFLA